MNFTVKCYRNIIKIKNVEENNMLAHASSQTIITNRVNKVIRFSMRGLWRGTSVNTAEGLSEGTHGAQSVILGSFCDHKKTTEKECKMPRAKHILWKQSKVMGKLIKNSRTMNKIDLIEPYRHTQNKSHF